MKSCLRPKGAALITGASSGIGRALAAEFAKDGYDIVLTARRIDTLRVLAEELQRRYSVTATVIWGDLGLPQGAEQVHAAVKEKEISLSALVNNAGAGLFCEFKDSPLETELSIMQVNMRSVVVLSKLFLPDLLRNQGKLLNVASTAAFQPGPNMAVYSATKAFVLSFSEAIAAELSGSSVTVTAFCPGPTASEFQEKAQMSNSAVVKGKRLPTAESVAAAGFRAMDRGQRVHVPGLMNALTCQAVRFAPRTVVTGVFKVVTRSI